MIKVVGASSFNSESASLPLSMSLGNSPFTDFTLLIEQGVSEVILHSFECLHLGEHRSNHSIITYVFKALIQSGGDDPVGMDSWQSEQEIIRRVYVNDITYHL